MRKLLTVLVTGVLIVALGAPAYAEVDNAQGSKDDQITAMRHRGDRDDGGRYRRHGHRYDDDGRRYYRHRHYRHYRHHGYPYYYGHPYGYGYYGRPAYYRHSDSRARECYDAYYYDRYFYDRYCRYR